MSRILTHARFLVNSVRVLLVKRRIRKLLEEQEALLADIERIDREMDVLRLKQKYVHGEYFPGVN